MRFPPSFIERLRSHFLLSEIIGKRVAIKKHGREFTGLCPFHNEKSPSFTVNDEKGFYHCFGCGAHGDAIEFIRRYEKLTYPETIERLARDAGIPLPQLTPEESKKAEREVTLHGVIDAACQWFESQLAASQGASARDYLEKRGLKPETLRQFRIGYAPEDKTGLHQHLLKVGFPQALQQEAGLIIVPDEGGGVYDRFRGRVMFPIRNASGKVVAFGGRLIANTSKNLAKYLNSPETPLFHKGHMLFNLDLAKRPARDQNMVVVMEGYMDVVSTHQGGIHYAVATLGTAVTPEHLRLLWQLAKEPVMCLDGDMAGKRAMMRAAEIALPLLKPGLSLRFAILPRGEDPDTYIQKHGKASFEKILASSKRLSQILWDTMLPRYRLDLPEGRAALDDALKKLSDRIQDATVRQHYASYFRKQLWAKAPASAKTEEARSPHVEQMVLSHHSAALDSLAQRLLHAVICFPALLSRGHVEETLSRLDVRSARLEAIRDAILSLGHDGPQERDGFVAQLERFVPPEALKDMAGMHEHLPYRETLTIEDAEKLWSETLSAYEVAHLQVELQELQDQVGQTMDEASYRRLVELQEAIKRAHAGRTFAPEQTDAT